MDVQTQVMDEPSQIYTADEMHEQMTLSDFKDQLSQIRAARIQIAQSVQGTAAEVKDLSASRSNLIGMFNSEAEAMYPELQGQDPFQAMSQLPESSPLIQLWLQYQGKIDTIVTAIKDKFAVMEQSTNDANALADQEDQLFNSYAAFYQTATTSIPTPDQLRTDIEATQVIPYVEEGTLRAELPMIEQLSPNAAAMVTLQTLEVASEGDYSDSPDQIEHQADAQVRSMAPSFDEDSATPSMPQVAAVAPAIIAQMTDPAVANAKLKTLGMWVGAAAVLYLFFGGKSREA